MEKLINAVNEYIDREYGEDSEITEIPKTGIIPIAYTTYDFDDGEEHEIQVSFDVNNLKYLNYIDDELVLEEPRDSIDEFIEEISVCDFNDIIRNCIHKGFELFGKD